MPSTWNRILEELQAEEKRSGFIAPWARLLRVKVNAITAFTKRPLIIYGSACTVSGKGVPPAKLQIDSSDYVGFHEMLEGLTGPNLDVIVHSPGGYPDATESIVEMIRRKFSHVRFIVPSYAKSAATMMAMSGDEIILSEDAELGPIDPQMLTPNGVSPAEAIKEQFERASKEILLDGKKLTIWLPILQPLGPALLVQCDNAIALSRKLVAEWLVNFMLRGVPDANAKADRVAELLAKHDFWKSHGRRVKFEHLNKPEFGLKLGKLEDLPALHLAAWEVYCVMDLVFHNTTINKLFYNSEHAAMTRTHVNQPPILVQPPTPAPQPAPKP